MPIYTSVHMAGLLILAVCFLVAYLSLALMSQARRHSMTMEALDEARRLQVEAVSSEVWKRDARIIKLNMRAKILQNDRELAAGRANKEEGARRAANALLSTRTRMMQGQEQVIYAMQGKQAEINARLSSLKVSVGVVSGKAHALSTQMQREGHQAQELAALAAAAKNTRQMARSLEVFTS